MSHQHTGTKNEGHSPHWICDCGVYNHKSRKRCLGCDKQKPKNIKKRRNETTLRGKDNGQGGFGMERARKK